MNVMHRHRIGRAFSRAGDYERHAHVQRRVARDLAGRIAQLDLPDAPRILEIGCGTGFLTQAMLEFGMDGDWLVTDISPEMVARCRAGIGDAPGCRFAVLDGEYGDPGDAAPFDLICSSFAMQWFDDQRAAVERMLGWLAPDGHCLFTSLASRSFEQWRAAHKTAGVIDGMIPFLSVADFGAIAPESQACAPQIAIHTERHDSGMEFLRSLKAIGADTARRPHRPLGPADLRRVVRAFEALGAEVTYEVVTCHFVR